jgi:hypothetical protein
MDLFFRVANATVLPVWLLLIIAPGSGLSRRVLKSPWVSAAPAFLYLALVVPRAPVILPIVVHPKLDAVATLLSTPFGATAAWTHFLAFDLLVARWIHLEALERRTSFWLLRVVLFCTLLAGPVGYSLWLGVRTMKGRAAS